VRSLAQLVKLIAASGVVLERPMRNTDIAPEVKYSGPISAGGGAHSIGGVAHSHW
jgi:hypothetical protein